MDELVECSKINGIIKVPLFDFPSSQKDKTFVTWPDGNENREPVCCFIEQLWIQESTALNVSSGNIDLDTGSLQK